ncbi:MAG: hypothetical protein ACJ78Q_16985 [Chloroflexia bacterium]
METETQLAFEGTKDEQKLAAHAFEAMKRKGILFGAHAPIRMSVDNIVAALTKTGGAMAGTAAAQLKPKVEAALLKNPEVFAREESGEFVTTKAGRVFRTESSQNEHTFKDRLNTEAVSLDPEAAKEYAESLVNRAAARAERTAIVDNFADMRTMSSMAPPLPHGPQINFDSATVIPQHLIPQPPPAEVEEPEEPRIPPARPGSETVISAAEAALRMPQRPPAAPAPAPRPQEAPEAAPAPRPEPATTAPATPAPVPGLEPQPVAQAQPAAAPPAPAPAPVTPEPVSAPQPVTQPAAQAPAPAPAPTPAPARPAPVEPPKPAAPVVTGPVEMRVTTDDGQITFDLRDSVDDLMANEPLAGALTQLFDAIVQEDSRLVRFGSEVFPEEAVERFSKGDFRRIKDFLDEPETGGVASDRDFMDYVFNRRPEHPDYERVRFSLDYRLLKEKKDFEFVGTDTNRLWMNAGAVPVAAPKRKPAEIGQDYRFLEDPAIVSVEEEDEVTTGEIGPLEVSLTYYEYENGVLPYDRRAKRIFQGPVLEDQRASLLQFEIPQLYTSVLAELRYPTGNRGGYIMGLADFFAEHMVPGARFTITPTDRADNIFEIQFIRTEEEEANLLQFDDRRSRYLFRPVSFSVETNPSMLLGQDKFGKLHNQKKLDEAERKRPDVVISNAFEAIGDQSDDKYWAILDDVYPVVNIERPISRSWLKTMLSGAYPFFYPDETTEGAYVYDPSKKPG